MSEGIVLLLRIGLLICFVYVFREQDFTWEDVFRTPPVYTQGHPTSR